MLSEALLSAIYDAISDDGALTRFSGLMAEEIGYRYGMVVIRGPGGPVEIAFNQPAVVMAGYSEHYYRLDPWARMAAQVPYGQVIAQTADEQKRFYDSEFYVDFARPMGVVDPIGTRMPIGAGIEFVLGLNQSAHAHLPTASDGEQVVALARHLQRALQLRQQLRQAVRMEGTLLSALSRVTFGMAITTAEGRIEVLNNAAEQAIVAGCGLQARNGFLTAKDAAMNGALRLMIQDASNGGAGGMLRIRSGAEGFSNVLIAPLPAQTGWRQESSRTLVAFRQVSAPSQLNAQMLMAAFGLSRGEAQVTVALLEGRSVEEIALTRGVKLSTVKSQLQAVFFKTGTSSQRELILQLLSLPVINLR